jgi:hypothetical protein
MDKDLYATFTIILCAISMALGAFFEANHSYVLSTYAWKCSNWEISNDEANCTAYALKVKNTS